MTRAFSWLILEERKKESERKTNKVDNIIPVSFSLINKLVTYRLGVSGDGGGGSRSSPVAVCDQQWRHHDIRRQITRDQGRTTEVLHERCELLLWDNWRQDSSISRDWCSAAAVAAAYAPSNRPPEHEARVWGKPIRGALSRSVAATHEQLSNRLLSLVGLGTPVSR